MPKKLEYDENEKARLADDYVNNHMTREEMMAKYGLSKKQLALRLSMYGIRKPEVRISKDELSRDYIDANMTRKAIAAKYGVSDAEIKKLLKEYGIKKDPAKVQDNVKSTIQNKYGVDYPLQKKEIRAKSISTMVDRYGVTNSRYIPGVNDKIRNTMIERYGVPAFNNREQSKKTLMSKYGDSYGSYWHSLMMRTNAEQHGDPNYNNREKAIHTMVERYGHQYSMQVDEIKAKAAKTLNERYGVDNAMKKPELLAKMQQTTFERYGAKSYLLTDACKDKLKATVKHSKPNDAFAAKLDAAGIGYDREFRIDMRVFDFKVGDDLIEIDPFATHNSTWSCFGKGHEPLSPDYHHDKSQLAAENGYRCIHVFDWDDRDKVIDLLKPKTRLAARKLKLRKIASAAAGKFLGANHLQGSCAGQSTCLALFDGDELIQVMTFGKPRYNRNYDFELLRLCTKSGFAVIGGAERLFRHFVKEHPGKSVLSYCDMSKFSGKVYERLGFRLKRKATPSRHWYNPDTGTHITDNLLKQRGFDQLFGTDFGKGTNNAELMIAAGFVEVFDAGQATYTYSCENTGV